MGKFVTTTQLAEMLNTSRVTLHREIKAGAISVAERDARGRPLFNPAVAGKEWGNRGDKAVLRSHHREGKSRGGRPAVNTPPPDPSPELTVAEATTDFSDFAELLRSLPGLNPVQQIQLVEAVKKAWDARNSMLKAMKEDGSLIAIEKVKSDGAELGAIVIGGLGALPDRLADRLSAMTDPHEIYELLTSEINIIIREIRRRCGVLETVE